MGTRMFQRRGTAAQWAAVNPVLGDGEIGVEKDTRVIKVGDGSTAWLSLPAAFNSQYLPILGKAADADRLDGLDSTEFIKQTEASAGSVGGSVVRRKSNGAIVSPDGSASDELTTFSQLSSYRRLTISRAPTASATLELGDEGRLISFNPTAAATLTIPLNSAVAFPIGGWFEVQTISTNGPVEIVPAAGVTMRRRIAGYNWKCVDIYSPVRFLKIGTDEWMAVSGNIDTGQITAQAAYPWSSNILWRVKNGHLSCYYVGTCAVATSTFSTIYTFPQGARPLFGIIVPSVYADLLREVNVSTAGQFNLLRAVAAGTGVAASATFATTSIL